MKSAELKVLSAELKRPPTLRQAQCIARGGVSTFSR